MFFTLILVGIVLHYLGSKIEEINELDDYILTKVENQQKQKIVYKYLPMEADMFYRTLSSPQWQPSELHKDLF